MYAKVVLKEAVVSFDREYIYKVPQELEVLIQPGACVVIPFGASDREVTGYVLSLEDFIDVDYFIKPILRIEEPIPMLNTDQLGLINFIRRKYLATHGDAIKLMVPANVKAGKVSNRTAFLSDPLQASMMVLEGEIEHERQVRVVNYLLEYGESLQDDVLTSCDVTKSTLDTLKKKGILEFAKYTHMPEDDFSDVRCEDTEFILNLDQQLAINEILSSDFDAYNEFLLFGITGSGKTEVYLSVMQDCLEKGHGAILLVPEISLTPMMNARLKKRFGDNVTVIHSGLSASKRNQSWQQILSGKSRLVVGPRSAVFSPVKNLKLIVIDEEQENTYKSQFHPQYLAHDIARARIGATGGALVLGSATPRIESYHQAVTGQIKLLRLPNRIGNQGLPEVKLVDMREELSSGNKDIFSRDLMASINQSLENSEKVMILINRRGYSSFYLCRDCGHIFKCSDCSISLTYHASSTSLNCHYCGQNYSIPSTCPECHSARIGGFGVGTQQVEELCRRRFPDRKILRMDSDTTSGSDAHERILKEFEEEGDILVGTQMIAKGHDFPTVTTVGILSADLSLGMSDFRASERTFALLTQAAGRAGRADKPGHVIIQAYNVDDYAISHAVHQDYPGFYEEEIIFRQRGNYPPFGHIGLIIVSSSVESKAYNAAKSIEQSFISIVKDCDIYPGRDFTRDQVFDVSKASIYKIRRRYRYRLVIKNPYEENINFYLAKLEPFKNEKDLYISYDTDPYQIF